MKRLLPAYFDKKRKKSIVSVFSSTYFLFAASSLSVGLARLAIFILFISLSVSWTESPGLLGCIRKLNFNSFFFFTSTNYFRRQLSSRRNNLKLLSSEFSLWTIFYIIENRLAFIHIVDLQRLDWIWCSSFTTFHLTSGKEISSLFKKGNIFWKPRHPFGWSLWRFEVHLVTVLKSDGMKFIEAII